MNEPIAYHATITEYDGTSHSRDYTASESDVLIDTATLFDDDPAVVTADRSGSITITRTLIGPSSALSPEFVMKKRLISLIPAASPRPSPRQYEDLTLIRSWEAQRASGQGENVQPFPSIHRNRATRLWSKGWLTSTGNAGGTTHKWMGVSYAGRISLALREHRTIGNLSVCFEPDFSVHSGNSCYRASCSCGWVGPAASEDLGISRGHARKHLRDRLQAAVTQH